MSEAIQISTQGISADLQTATGDYDAIELGAKTTEQLIHLLTTTMRIPVPANEHNEDLCPCGVLVESSIGVFSFIVGDNSIDIYGAPFGNEELELVGLTPQAAAALVIGQLTPADAAKYKQTPAPALQATTIQPQQPQQHQQKAQGPGPVRRFIGNAFSAVFIITGIAMGIDALSDPELAKSGTGSVVAALVFVVVIFGGLAWASRRFIGGIGGKKSQARDTQDDDGLMAGTAMGMMMNNQDMSDDSGSDYGGGDDGGAGGE
jgi:hypothetical protein